MLDMVWNQTLQYGYQYTKNQYFPVPLNSVMTKTTVNHPVWFTVQFISLRGSMSSSYNHLPILRNNSQHVPSMHILPQHYTSCTTSNIL